MAHLGIKGRKGPLLIFEILITATNRRNKIRAIARYRDILESVIRLKERKLFFIIKGSIGFLNIMVKNIIINIVDRVEINIFFISNCWFGWIATK